MRRMNHKKALEGSSSVFGVLETCDRQDALSLRYRCAFSSPSLLTEDSECRALTGRIGCLSRGVHIYSAAAETCCITSV